MTAWTLKYLGFCAIGFATETELASLLRHIRNAFAHGYLYVWRKRKGTYIVLVDFDSSMKNTAMIIVTDKILEDWKAILENEIPIGE